MIRFVFGVLAAFGLAMSAFAQGPVPDSSAAADSTLVEDSVAAEDSGATVDSSVADELGSDPLQLYLQSLSDSTESFFQDPALESLSVSDAEVDSLIRLYEETGNAPHRERRKEWKARFGLGGARYNRVEGLNVIPRMTIVPPTPLPIEISGRVGYGWSAKELTGGAGVRAQITRQMGRPALHASWARDVYSYGSGIISGNSLTAFMLGKDYSDYFRAEGWAAGVEFMPGALGIDLTFRAERQESLVNAAAFTLFEGDDEFRPNPSIDDGDDHRVQLDARWSDWAQSPWTAIVSGGIARRGLGGDFAYETLHAEGIHRHRLWFGDRVIASLSGGWIGGAAPFQAAHHLGGFERLRGYEVNEITAREYGHARLDYEVGWNPFQWVPYVHKLRIQPIAFGDAAAVLKKQSREGDPIDLESPEWKFATGVGLQHDVLGIPGGGGQIRFEVARRLDRADDAVTYRLRFNLQRH